MTLRKATRHPQELGTLSLYSALDELGRSGLTIDSAQRKEAFLRIVEKGLAASLGSASRLHGRRVETMFAGVVLAIGGVRLLSFEDQGDYYFDDVDGPVKAPDFRVVDTTGQHLLVEVKNVGPDDTTKPQTMKRTEFEGAVRYAELTGARLGLAHYWSAMNLWTLVSADVLEQTGVGATLTIETAIPANEFSFLGDKWLATTPPLVLSLLADPTRARSVQGTRSKQKASFTIGGVELSCAGHPINDPIEREIASRLMLFGSWHPTEEWRVDARGKVERLDYVFAPLERSPEPQDFEMVGTLSSMYSAMYNFATLSETGEVTSLRQEPEPGVLTELVPDDYWARPNRSLPLWRFEMKPNTEVTTEALA
jgi:hypothetical protein